MSKRVAIYARVSTTRQAENDISIPDQIAQTRMHCEARGWYVVREFVDPGASARDDKRPQFQAMMDAGCVDPSPFDIVLVHSQSRFFRDTAGYVVSKRRLQKHGVSLVSMTRTLAKGLRRSLPKRSLPPPMRSIVPRRPSMSPAPCLRTPAKASGTAQSRPLAIARSPSNSAAREPRNALRSKPRKPRRCD